MSKCPNCGAELPPGALFCANCGAELPPDVLFCANCGAELTPDAMFCAKCGAVCNAIPEHRAAQQSLPPPGAQPGYYQQQQQQQQPLPPPQPQQQVPQQQPFMPPGAAQPVTTPGVGTSKIIIAIIAAAVVILLGGGFAVAWFSGALDNVFNKPAALVTVNGEDDATTTARVEETTTTTAATTTVATTTVAAVTTAAPTIGEGAAVAAISAQVNEPDVEQATTLKLEPDPLVKTLLSQYGLAPYISDDTSPKGIITETCVNYSNIFFGSYGNYKAGGMADLSSIASIGLECDVAFDIKDVYLKEITDMILGPYGDEMQAEVLRLLGSSEFRLNFEAISSIPDDISTPVFSAQADWLVQARNLLTVLAYANTGDIMFTAPGLTDKVFRMDSMIDMILDLISEEMDSLVSNEDMSSSVLNNEDFKKYFLEFRPYFQHMIIAAIDEMETPEVGKEEISLGYGEVVFDTIDVVITGKSLMNAGAAALNILMDSPDAQDIIIRAWNEVLAGIAGSETQLDRQTMSFMLGGMLAQLNQGAKTADTKDLIVIRFYINDRALAGLAINDPNGWEILGAVTAKDLGYSFWYNNYSNKEYQKAKDMPLQPDRGVGDRYEVYGSFVNSSQGMSGDIKLKIRQYGENLDCTLMTYSIVNTAYSAEVQTASFTLKINLADLYNTFAGKKYSRIDIASGVAHLLDGLDDLTFIKDSEVALEFSIKGDLLSMVISAISASSPSQNCSASITFKIYEPSDIPTPLQGDIIDVSNPDVEAIYEAVGEIIDKLNVKVDALVAAGYKIDWVKPMISSAVAGIVDMGAEIDGYTDMYGDGGNGSGAAISAAPDTSDMYLKTAVTKNWK